MREREREIKASGKWALTLAGKLLFCMASTVESIGAKWLKTRNENCRFCHRARDRQNNTLAERRGEQQGKRKYEQRKERKEGNGKCENERSYRAVRLRENVGDGMEEWREGGIRRLDCKIMNVELEKWNCFSQ